jgi:hypothetical protein
MSKTKNKVSRKSMEEALRAGCHVGVSGGVILRADHLGRVEGGRLNQIFGQAEHVEAAIVRDPAGFLTIAGMHHAINHGGSVMLNGEVISNIDDLPDEERLEALRAETADAVNASIDNQLALLTCAKANVRAHKDFSRRDAADYGMSTTEAPPPADPKAPPPVPPADASNVTSPDAKTTGAPADFDAMKKPELLAAAKEHGIDGTDKMTNEELRAALRTAAKKEAK